jgi:hypothetical protein
MWEPRRLTTIWAFTACYRESFASFLPLEVMRKVRKTSAMRNDIRSEIRNLDIFNTKKKIPSI